MNFYIVGTRSTGPLIGGFPVYSVTDNEGKTIRGHIVAVFVDRERAHAYADYMTRRQDMAKKAAEAIAEACRVGAEPEDEDESEEETPEVKPACKRVGSVNVCSCCGVTGHKRPTCKYQHSRRKCAVCGYAGHDARTCTAEVSE